MYWRVLALSAGRWFYFLMVDPICFRLLEVGMELIVCMVAIKGVVRKRSSLHRLRPCLGARSNCVREKLFKTIGPMEITYVEVDSGTGFYRIICHQLLWQSFQKFKTPLGLRDNGEDHRKKSGYTQIKSWLLK